MLKQYIKENFPKCLRENIKDDGTLIGLPRPYTVPCMSGAFQEMYYWDTYFTNKGLVLCGFAEQAKNNVDNMLYLVSRFGFMLNGNRTWFLRNSQPPFLSLMVRDVYEITGDKEWLKDAVKSLETEYDFWQTKRITKTGLNRYSFDSKDADLNIYTDALRQRLGFEAPIDTDLKKAEHFMVNAESGWDCTPRFEFKGFYYNPIDLNCLLYAFENNMQFFNEEIVQDSKIWEDHAEKRKDLINKLMKSDSGLYFDYDFEVKKHSPVFSAASFFPMFVGISDEVSAKATRDNLYRIETDFGIAATEKFTLDGNYQWAYPNGWAPLHYIVVKALINYGYIDDAKRIAEKYVKTVEANFKTTNNLWEKYNVEDGSINTSNEYEMPPMLGWTAGVYLACKEILEEITV